jgi:hypothetical protein
VTFVSTSLGWAWGPDPRAAANGSGAGVLARTLDYGHTWTVLPTPHIDSVMPGVFPDRGVSDVTFVTPLEGYLFGGRLYATSDGGHVWSRRRVSGPVWDVEAGAGRAYALVAACPTCAARLYLLAGDGRELVDAGPPPGLWTGLVVHGLSVYLLGFSTPRRHRRSVTTLWASHDGGETWQRETAPCPIPGLTSGTLAAWSATGLVLVCGGQPGAGSQAKTIYASTDGGARWQLTTRMPMGPGYVASLAAADRDTWVLAEGRIPSMEITRDGGRSWRPVTFRGQVDDGVEGWGYVGFTDPTQAVAVPWTLNGSVLAVTNNDARTWREVAFPSGRG